MGSVSMAHEAEGSDGTDKAIIKFGNKTKKSVTLGCAKFA